MGKECLENGFHLMVIDLTALSLKIPIMHGIDHRNVIATIATCRSSCIFQIFSCWWCTCFTWLDKPNITVLAPTNNNIVATRHLLTLSPSITMHFNVNANYN